MSHVVWGEVGCGRRNHNNPPGETTGGPDPRQPVTDPPWWVHASRGGLPARHAARSG